MKEKIENCCARIMRARGTRMRKEVHRIDTAVSASRIVMVGVIGKRQEAIVVQRLG